jgi:hypothetical protein
MRSVASVIMESPRCPARLFCSHRRDGNAGEFSVSFNLLSFSSTLFCHRYDMAVIQHCLFTSTNNNKGAGRSGKNSIILCGYVNWLSVDTK